MWQAKFKLYLYPSNFNKVIDHKTLVELLLDEQFIDKKLAENRYSTGNKFVSLLTFMGCSPDIELEPQENSPYCYIEIETKNKAQFISGSNLKKARCTHCKKDITDPVHCPHCQQTLNPENINWRKTAFFTSSWITIGNIYELEAIPNDHFLDILEKQTSVKWNAAYIRD